MTYSSTCPTNARSAARTTAGTCRGCASDHSRRSWEVRRAHPYPKGAS